MAEFVMADPHFGHTRIIDYCNRPFTSVEEMDTHIVNQVNSVVGEDGVCYWGGDIFFGNVEYGKGIRRRLQGRHYTLLGNHDQRSKLVAAGWVISKKAWILQVRGHQNYLRFTHKPDYKFDAVSQYRHPAYSLYGHLHNRPHKAPLGGLCISAELLDYTPITLQEALRRCKEKWGENLRNPLPQVEGLGA